MIRGIDQVARDQGYHLLVSSSHGDPQAQRKALERLPGRVDGVVVMSPSLGDSGVHEDALPGGLPAVLLNCAGTASQRPVLNVDNYGGARVMTRHLRDSGHRRIAFIAGPDDNFDAHERLRGYRDELALDAQAQPWVLPGNFDEESGYRAGQTLAQHDRPDAVFAANDMMALGCLFALGHAGLKVPHDIALAGFDDVPMARYVLPALTTMRVDIAGLGARAAAVARPAAGGRPGATGRCRTAGVVGDGPGADRARIQRAAEHTRWLRRVRRVASSRDLCSFLWFFNLRRLLDLVAAVLETTHYTRHASDCR